MDKKISRRLQLKDNHPTAQKLAKLCELADELGISISFYSYRTVIEDTDRDPKLPPLYLEDIETGEGMDEFPFQMEYKLVYDNPEWIAQEAREREERERARVEEAERKRKAEEEKQRAAAEKARRTKEQRERELLAVLKDKYENVSNGDAKEVG
jgi:hypothetical protein